MDVSNISNLSTSIAATKTNSATGIAVLKKALDTQASSAAGLIQALPPLPSNTNIGRNINIKA
ncbi:MAG: YjfB family protein [Candidatus Accumulibacter sp.]|jgi:hypothetical protein|nr:YjfB family protein [Accumulibacter sp.]